MSELYLKTHSRFGSYVVGMLTGYFLYWVQKEKREFKLRRVKNRNFSLVIINSDKFIGCGPVCVDCGINEFSDNYAWPEKHH